ncbi:MAG: cofactor-independent phosphoglycerate mutase [Acidobacteria bacterium]|nr:cofactor-independent phosphoglycerate mutase [Acidobacteriota bacterium]
MKYAIVLPDGAADEPLPELDGRTPLEAARLPNMDWVAAHGVQGRLVTVPAGFTPATDVATLTLFGYNPARYYSGRAPLEALAKGLAVRPDQIVFRCNFVTIADGRMRDFTAGHIAQRDADRFIADLNDAFAADGLDFHAGVSYRNLLLAPWPPAGDGRTAALRCAPPHDIPEQPVAEHMPRGEGAECVVRIMERAAELLAGHPVNSERLARGERAATNIWLWGQGRPIAMESFASRFGLRAAVICAVDIIRGLARGTGMELIEVPGATGYIDTNFEGKGQAAVRAVDDHDLVIVHVEAADEAGHLGDAAEKVKALERIDAAVVGPLLERLRREPAWRMLIAPDHPTPVGTKAHSATPPPFCYAGTGVAPGTRRAFTEKDADATGLWVEPAFTLIARFLS